MRLAILTSHPIQYQAPWFRALARAMDLQVIFAHRQSAAAQGQAGFGVAFDWDVDLLAGYTNRFLKNVSRHPGVNGFFGCDTPDIKPIIYNGKFDAFIVCGWYLKSYWQAARACRQAGVPVLARGDSQLRTPRSRLKRWLKYGAYRFALRWLDAFLVVGQRNREYLEYFGVSAEKIFFVPHLVDNEWFRAEAEEARRRRSEVRGQWGFGDDVLCALFVGKFQPLKRPGDILKALALLRGREINTVGVFVGAGELEAQLRTEASRACLGVKFVGFKNQSELPACYASADVLVLPSESETWGLVVNEAMACGVPAVVSEAVGCVPDLIDEGHTGFTFPVGDIRQLADRLQQIARIKRNGHDWRPALEEKLRAYGVEAAVEGTLRAVSVVSRQRFAVHTPVIRNQR